MTLIAASSRRLPPAHDESNLALAALAAALAHLVLAILLAIAPGRDLGALESEPIAVEIMTPEEFRALTPNNPPPPAMAIAPPPLFPVPTPESLPPATQTAPPRPVPVPPPASGMVHATVMLAASVLAHPRSRGMRAFLSRVEPETRLEQLCGIEAMAQIGRHDPAHHPDRVVAYAMTPSALKGDALVADGAAFRSNGQWFRLKFRCEGSRDRNSVTGLDFEIGAPIPRGEWAARNLPANH